MVDWKAGFPDCCICWKRSEGRGEDFLNKQLQVLNVHLMWGCEFTYGNEETLGGVYVAACNVLDKIQFLVNYPSNFLTGRGE